MADHVRFSFSSSAAPDADLRVLHFVGEEAISSLYRFDIELASTSSDIDGKPMLGKAASLTLESYDDSRTINGVIAEFEASEQLPGDLYLYRAVLVPRFWLLTLSQHNRIFGTDGAASLSTILPDVFNGVPEAGLSGNFELKLSSSYPERDQVVQYNESDHAFASRMMEHFGVSYFFNQEGHDDKLICCDQNVFFPDIEGGSDIRFQPGAGMTSDGEAAIQRFAQSLRPLAGSVELKDYNYRLPHVPLYAKSAVTQGQYGSVAWYGDHFRTPEEGTVLARVRAEQLAAGGDVYSGQGTEARLAAGHCFTMNNHFRDGFNQRYLITRLRHEGGDKLAGAGSLGQSVRHDESLAYRNSFEAIPADVTFRPERKTPKPQITGLMHAYVESSGSGERADIDDQGRYKVSIPYNMDDRPPYKGSQFMRMAQPHGGIKSGMHFPLRKGAEVVFACLDGNPDRPIITGAVPNPTVPSLVATGNHTQNRIRTASGIQITMNDGPGAPESGGGGGGGGAGAAGVMTPQRQMEGPPERQALREGASGFAAIAAAPSRQMIDTAALGVTVSGYQALPLPRHMDGGGDEGTVETPDGVYYALSIPSSASSMTPSSYFRLGEADDELEENISNEEKVDDANEEMDCSTLATEATGIYLYTGHDYQQQVKSNKGTYVYGNNATYVAGNEQHKVQGTFQQSVAGEFAEINAYTGVFGKATLEMKNKAKLELHLSSDEGYTLGYKFDSWLGVKQAVEAGLSFSQSAAANVKIENEIGAKIGSGGEFSYGESTQVASEQTISASETVTICLRPGLTGGIIAGMSAVNVASMAYIGTVNAGLVSTDVALGRAKDHATVSDATFGLMGIGLPAAGAVLGATTVAAASAAKAAVEAANLNVADPQPSIMLSEAGVYSSMGPESFHLLNEEGSNMITPLVKITAEGDINITSFGVINIKAPVINSTGEWNHKGALSVEGDVSITGTQENTGDVAIDGELWVNLDSIMIGDLTVAGAVECAEITTGDTTAGDVDCAAVETGDVTGAEIDAASVTAAATESADVASAAVESSTCIPC